MVDVSDLGSEFWRFKSASGYSFYKKRTIRPLGETVYTVALKATFFGSVSSSLTAGTGGYSLVVKY